jgi:hypothetical protein
MALQALFGLSAPELYRDTGYAAETWFGNDVVTLSLALPTLLAGLALDLRGSTRGRLLWLGGLGYGVYNYAFYLLGAALNALFPLYVFAFVMAGTALVLLLVATDVPALGKTFHARTPVRWVGGYLVFVAVGLTGVWLSMWAAYVFAGASVPGDDPAAFRLVAALDLTLMVPALGAGGVLLWRRRPWGFVLSAIGGIQGTLYLSVLTLNAVLFLARGLTEPPGELPVWGTLVVTVGLATWVLVRGAGAESQRGERY